MEEETAPHQRSARRSKSFYFHGHVVYSMEEARKMRRLIIDREERDKINGSQSNVKDRSFEDDTSKEEIDRNLVYRPRKLKRENSAEWFSDNSEGKPVFYQFNNKKPRLWIREIHNAPLVGSEKEKESNQKKKKSNSRRNSMDDTSRSSDDMVSLKDSSRFRRKKFVRFSRK